MEDEPNLLEYSRRKLIRGGHNVLSASTLAEARKVLCDSNIDLVVLDIMLPDGNGLDLCREIKASSDISVLFLTGKTQISDRVAGLDGGGDYYMVKPYDLDEFLSVVNSLLRRSVRHNFKEVGGISLDFEKMTASVKGRDLMLTPKEFTLLGVLVRHQNTPISATELYDKCWPNSENSYNNSMLWAQLSRLRKKLESAGLYYITSVRNQGYCLEIKE